VTVRTGLERLLREGLPQIHGKRIGLVTNHTGIDSRLRHGIDLLASSARFRLTALFGPEHGVRGADQAGVHVGEAVDARTGLRAHSLYGETRKPTDEMLADVDALLFDIQDVGVRLATYVSTLWLVQQAAAEVGLPLVVLDRPNPIAGLQVEGNLVEAGRESFVGIHAIPIRHGLTFGELARLSACDNGWPEPRVVAMEGWERGMWFDQTGLPWVQPSPNLPTLDSVTVYPGTCLIEGTNVSEGRGTTRPLELVGAPWVDPYRLAGELEARGIPGAAFRATWFTPTFSKHHGTTCGGVQVHVLDRQALRPVELGIHLIHAFMTHCPREFAWRKSEIGTYFIYRLLGSAQPRQMLDTGSDARTVYVDWPASALAFQIRTSALLLYR